MRHPIKDSTFATALVLAAVICLSRGLTPTDSPAPASINTTPVSYAPAVEREIAPQAIETIRVGQRIWIGNNPSAEHDTRIGGDIDERDQWRKMVPEFRSRNENPSYSI